MNKQDLQYHLPPELIAQHPCSPRDAARLLVLDRATGAIRHRVFRDIGDYLGAGDCLVLNDTRVLPARFFCRRSSGGRIEGLFLHAQSDTTWRMLLRPSARLRIGERLIVCGRGADGPPAGVVLELLERPVHREWRVRPDPAVAPHDLLERVGEAPLPPYIRRPEGPDADDAARYQTVYADRAGAVAAPTAGLHFTPELLGALEGKGVRRAAVTLHVGLGTFAPIEVDDLEQHPMHAERFSVGAAAAETIAATRAAGGRLIAVGTTSVRTLESFGDRPVGAAEGETRLFIRPPFVFQHVDRLITNFHLPGSTLLALVGAFAGMDRIRAAYAEAIRRRYRFYSYGDAMLIL